MPPRAAKRGAAKSAGSPASKKAAQAAQPLSLASLLEPALSEAAFFRSHWEQRHLHTAAPGRDFAQLFSLDALLAHIDAGAAPQLRHGRVRRWRMNEGGGRGGDQLCSTCVCAWTCLSVCLRGVCV